MRAGLLLALVALSGCSPANANDAEFWTPSSASVESTDEDAGTDPPPEPGTDAGTTPPKTDAGTPKPSGTCLRVEFTTVSYFGRYAPSHVGAVWITDASGKFVKTLQEWGVRRSGNLYNWRQSAGGNTVDAITGATLKSHVAHKLDWNCTNVSKARVAPGKYTVHAEFAESNVSGASNAGPTFEAAFEVGVASTDTPADSKGYKAKLIKVTAP